jgi:uncharacterized protein YbaR (Trm112 family)
MSKRLVEIETCPECNGQGGTLGYLCGSGHEVKYFCVKCSGTGEVRTEVTRADDGELANDEWIDRVLPSKEVRGPKFGRITKSIAAGGSCLWLNGELIYTTNGQFHYKLTRGDLRRLCAALGVVLKEGG